MAGTIANVLSGMVACGIVLMSMCGGGIVDIWLIFSQNDAGSDITMDMGHWFRCN